MARRSVVHQGPMDTPKILYAPHKWALINVLVVMQLSMWWSWKWIVIGAAVHGMLALFWWYDQHLLPIVVATLVCRGPDGRPRVRRRWYGVS